MDIEIKSAQQIVNLVPCEGRYAIINIGSPLHYMHVGDKTNTNLQSNDRWWNDLIFIKSFGFDDVTEHYKGYLPISCHQGLEIAEAIKDAYKQEAKILYINCEAGVSRSAAVASAAYLYMGEETKSDNVWRDGRYYPNELVYRRVLEGFNIPVSYEKLNKLIEINILEVTKSIHEGLF